MKCPCIFSRFHPDYRMTDLPPTPYEKVIEAVEMALAKGFHFAYAGNLHSDQYQNTICPACKTIIVDRCGYTIRAIRVTDDRRCQNCRHPVNVITG